jgi:D-inositol-3-phosphate glycosyltransferase
MTIPSPRENPDAPLSIAMLSYHTCPLAVLGGKDTGGMNVYVRELTRQLGRSGVHVDVFTRSQDAHVPHVVHDLGYGNRVVHVPAGPEIPLPKKELAGHLDAFVDGVLDFSRRKGQRYDLIHSHYWMSGIAAQTLKRRWNLPIVHMFHTLGLMKNRIAGDGEREGDYRIRGEREVLRSADKIVAATPAELAQLQWLYEVRTEHVRIIPPGVDTTHFYPIPQDEAREFIGAAARDKILLFVGRIEPLKGIESLLRSLGILRQRGALDRHNLCLAVIGGDAAAEEEVMSAEMSRLQALRAELGLHDLVTFLGKKSQGVLPYYYSAADLVVVPSHYESFGMVALEAMACGTPVVASQVGGLAFLVQDGVTGYHVPDQDAPALADRLELLLDSPETRARMGRAGAQLAKAYTWQLIAAQIRALYGEVLAERRSPESAASQP